MADRILLAALLDQIIFGNDETFRAKDASEVWRLLDDAGLPRTGVFQFHYKSQIPGSTFSGFAPGFGNVSLNDDRSYEYDSAGKAILRAGQWKIMRRGRCVDVIQVMGDDEQQSARLVYTRKGQPQWLLFGVDVDFPINIPIPRGRNFGIVFGFRRFRHWKKMIQ